MPSSSSEEARQGLSASVLGKVKEVVGAVTGNDSLATQGQLQQAEAAARKEASATEAICQTGRRSVHSVWIGQLRHAAGIPSRQYRLV